MRGARSEWRRARRLRPAVVSQDSALQLLPHAAALPLCSARRRGRLRRRRTDDRRCCAAATAAILVQGSAAHGCVALVFSTGTLCAGRRRFYRRQIFCIDRRTMQARTSTPRKTDAYFRRQLCHCHFPIIINKFLLLAFSFQKGLRHSFCLGGFGIRGTTPF
jgi:hypothetical protein